MLDLAEFLKVLSDETRLRIVILLLKRELCVCEICDVIDESQPKVSRHLAKLRDAGFVNDERRSQWVFYCLNIKSETAIDILNSIIRNIDEHSTIKADMLKLNSKIESGNLCERAGKILV